MRTADVMINSNPPRERLRERAPRLKWIQTTGAGVDSLVPLDWLPPDLALTNNRGARGEKARAAGAGGDAKRQSRPPGRCGLSRLTHRSRAAERRFRDRDDAAD